MAGLFENRRHMMCARNRQKSEQARRALPGARREPPLRPPFVSDGCRDPQHGRNLLLYLLDLLNPEEQDDFEAHLLDCDACFDALKGLDRAAIDAMQLMLERETAGN